MKKIQNKFIVESVKKLSKRFVRLSLKAETIRKHIKPGQFLHIRVGESLEPFFRRPFSVYRAKGTVDIFFEPVGPGTRILAGKKPGDELDVLGPLGRSFDLPPRGIKTVIMIAGGIGIAPFLILSDILRTKGYKLIVLYGGRTRDHVFNMKEFKANGCEVHVATDDGSVGVHGRVLQLFDRIKFDPARTFLYTCGPNAMLKAVQDFARKNDLRGQASCEEVMACALGACLGCSIETVQGYRTVCYDGPVFDLNEIIFES